MQVDHATQAPPLQVYFEAGPDTFPWNEERTQQVERRRALLGDLLIFDILLSSGGIAHPDVLYPPHDLASLQELLSAIDASHYDTLKRECLVYFLLKWHQDGREDRFAFASLADAYWHLDSGVNVPRLRLENPPSHFTDPDPTPLILKYVRTAKPLLTEPDDIKLYTLALAESNFFEAWQYQRTFSENDENRPQLFKTILEWCLLPRPRTSVLTQLLSYPFTQFEESLLRKHALEPPSSLSPTSIAILQDLICVRLVEHGRYTEAIRMDRLFTSSTPNASKPLPQSQDRTKMVQDLYAALPLTERSLLDVELENSGVAKPNGKGQKAAEDSSMSESWEDIRPEQAKLNGKKAVPAPRLVERPSVQDSAAIASSSTSNVFAPRKSLPQTSFTLLAGPALLPSRSLHAGTSNSPAGKPKYGEPPTLVTRTNPAPAAKPNFTFTSAVRQQNAFYRPPVNVNTNTSKAAFGANDKNIPPKNQPVPDIHMDDMESNDGDNEGDIHAETNEGQPVLGFSVFGKNGNGNGNSNGNGVRPEPEVEAEEEAVKASRVRKEEREKEKASTSKSKRTPPGAFHSDEHDGEDAGPAIVVQPRTSTSTRGRNVSAKIKKQDLGRSLPGSLMDDDEEEEEEEEDTIAPLRAPSPPRRALRKPRASVSSEPADDGETRTRRRSSRLSATGSVAGMSPEPASPKKISARRSTKTSTSTRKKR
ncbi:nuclear pore complex assembly-domain-containing protein [Infundibulicybe gibba]|nr:nuclear pore complex assembly-domain-containing protein [Infundibulicybe gibba]